MKILLADSDTENLRNFKLYINKNFPDIRIVGSVNSHNGIFGEVKRLTPDVIISDVRFFAANGFAALNDIFEFYPNTKYIVYGYYNDTQYIERIMRFGVIDYIYRPVKPTDLHRALEKAAAVFSEIAKNERDRAETLKELEIQKPFYRDMFLSSLIDGSVTGEFEITNNFSYFGIDLKPPFTVILLKIDHFKKVILALDEQEKHLLLHRLNAVIQSKLAEKGLGISLRLKMHTNIIIMGGITGFQELLELAESIKTEVSLEIKQSVTMGIGRSYDKYHEIACSYKEAEAALRHRYYMGYNTVIPIQYAEPDNYITYRYPLEKEEKLVYHAVCGEYENCIGLVSEICGALNNAQLPEGLLPKIIMDIVISINRFISERDGHNLDDFMSFFPTKEIFGLGSTDEAQAFLTKSLKEFCRRMSGLRSIKSKEAIERAKLYLEENYNKNVSLKDIALIAKTPPEYFSRLFTEYEKKSIFDYVTGLRIGSAKKMLAETDKSEDSVSQTTGFDDHLHFRRIFKQYTSQTPSEFRKRNKGQ